MGGLIIKNYPTNPVLEPLKTQRLYLYKLKMLHMFFNSPWAKELLFLPLNKGF